MNESIEQSFGLRAILIRDYLPGWSRRRRDGRSEPISGRRLLLHRILWGFHRLSYTGGVWSPFTVDGRIDSPRLAAEGWHFLGHLAE